MSKESQRVYHTRPSQIQSVTGTKFKLIPHHSYALWDNFFTWLFLMISGTKGWSPQIAFFYESFMKALSPPIHSGELMFIEIDEGPWVSDRWQLRQ